VFLSGLRVWRIVHACRLQQRGHWTENGELTRGLRIIPSISFLLLSYLDIILR